MFQVQLGFDELAQVFALLNLAQADGFVVTDQTGGTARIALTGIPWANLSKTGSSLADLATRSASDLSSGTLPDARFPATLPALNGSNLTALNASNLGSGTVPLARIAGLTNTEVDASAAIALSKLASLTGNRVLTSNGSGVIAASSVTDTELGYLAGVTSAIQTQLSTKAPTSRSLTAGTGLSGGGDLSADRTFTLNLAGLAANQTIWDSSQASRTLTAGLSGATDPVITFSDGVVNVSTGALQVGGTAVSVSGHAHAASDITSGTLATARGGTGQDTSASTGIPLITAGTWSVLSTTGTGNAVRATSPTITTPTIAALANLTTNAVRAKTQKISSSIVRQAAENHDS
jgi:hypothetical protein